MYQENKRERPAVKKDKKKLTSLLRNLFCHVKKYDYKNIFYMRTLKIL